MDALSDFLNHMWIKRNCIDSLCYCHSKALSFNFMADSCIKTVYSSSGIPRFLSSIKFIFTTYLKHFENDSSVFWPHAWPSMTFFISSLRSCFVYTGNP